MRTPKVSTSFSGFTDANLETKAQLILASMTGNPAFANPIPTLAELQTAVTRYSTDLVAAAALGRTNVANKNASRQLLENILAQLGMYVMYIANGDEAILISSGYSMLKSPEPIYITNPGNVTLSNGITTGQMMSVVNAVSGARTYLHEICTEQPTAATVWTSNPSSRRQFTFTDLVAGKQYWVRVGVTGSGEQLAYSPIANQFAQ